MHRLRHGIMSLFVAAALLFSTSDVYKRQGMTLVQVEAYLNQRKIYLKTNVYLKPECWSREGVQVINLSLIHICELQHAIERAIILSVSHPYSPSSRVVAAT